MILPGMEYVLPVVAPRDQMIKPALTFGPKLPGYTREILPENRNIAGLTPLHFQQRAKVHASCLNRDHCCCSRCSNAMKAGY